MSVCVALGSVSCQQSDDDSGLPFGSSGSSSNTSPASPQFLASCQGYCAHVYTTAVECDPTVLESEGNACYAFCNIQGQNLSEACETSLIDAYDCVVLNEVAYACAEEQGSAITEETTCADDWNVADSCLAQQ